MTQDVSTWVRGCNECNCSKLPSKPQVAPLQPHQIPERPFYKIAVDFCGPYVETSRGHKYVLQVQDLLTRYIMFIPTADQTAITAARAVVDRWICQFDIPHVQLSDHSPAFESNLFKGVCKELGIEKVYSTPYHPQANGQVERQNRTVNQSLTTLVNDNRDNWDILLPKIAFAFNTTSQATTQMSPFELVFHSSPRRPDSMLVPHAEDEVEVDDDPDYTPHTKTPSDQQRDAVKHNTKKWEKVYQAVRRRIKNAQEKRAQNQAKRDHPFHPHKPGDRVRKKNHTIVQGSSKLSKPIKPDIYVVRRKLGDVNYEIILEDNSGKEPELVHHNELIKVHKQNLRHERELESEDEVDDFPDEENMERTACNPLRKSQRQRNPVNILQVQPDKKTYLSQPPID